MNDYESSLLPDSKKKEGFSGFSVDTMFDRIINLKLSSAYYTKSDGMVVKDEYVIRSDWEMFYPEMGKIVTGEAKGIELKDYYIRRCVHKPSIKVQYKQIASGTAIEIDIFVSNFIMMSADGRAFMSFNNLTYPLQQIELQMGYFSQFKDMPANAKQFFDFSPRENVDTLTVNIAYVQTDKLPPDGVLHIHGYVGSCYNPPLSSLKGSEMKPTYDNIKDVKQYYNDYLKDYIFTNVTRRFLRKTVSSEEVKVNEDTGLMSVEDAKKYGVKVFLSSVLETECNEAIKRKEVKDKNGKTIKNKVTGVYSESVVQAMNRFREEFGVDISIKALIDGNYVAYMTSESTNTQQLAETLKNYKYEDTDLVQAGSVVDKIFHNVIPAVENITTDALCTIVCPFYYFLNPFDMIRFKSRYALGGVVTYYANFSEVESKFWALYMSVSFATVEDINECTIVCTGAVE
jgi:hypothetical protein